MRMKKLSLLFLLFPFVTRAQQYEKIDNESGYFELGIRNTVSAFSDDGAYGFGYGGQFRIRVLSRVNTDWYADYITTDIAGIARRVDMHIGWSVLAYPFNDNMVKGKWTPYILAGHCFDYTKVSKNNSDFFRDKWSSAVQAGLGVHYNLTDRMNVSLTTQYMMHLGYDVNTQVFDGPEGKKDVYIEKTKVSGVEGHLLVNVCFSVRLFDMWDQRRKKA